MEMVPISTSVHQKITQLLMDVKPGKGHRCFSTRVDHPRTEFAQRTVNAQPPIAHLLRLRIQQAIKVIAMFLAQLAAEQDRFQRQRMKAESIT